MQQHEQNQLEQQMDPNEMSLREHLLAAQAAGQAHVQTPHHEQLQIHNPIGHHPHQIDPSMSNSQYGVGPGVDQDDMDDSKRVKNRELSNSKRAAQNRAAQRAFRQRKEGYIKKLEEQVRAFNGIEDSYKHLQSENYELRGYICQLQSRLLESQGSYPQPPPSISSDMHQRAPLPAPTQAHLHTQQQHDPSIHARHDQHHLHMSARTASMTAKPEQQQQQQRPQHHDQSPSLYDAASSDAQMSPAAVDQLQAAAAAAQAGEYVADEEIKHGLPGINVDEEDAYAIEAARAAAFAATKPVEDVDVDDEDVGGGGGGGGGGAS